jgi:hypothetical protein
MAVAPGSAELDPAEQTKFTTLRSGRVTAAAPAGETAVRQVDLPKSPIDLQSLTQRARAIGSAEVSDCPRVAEPSNIALRPAMPSAHQANIVHPAAEIRALASPLQPTGNSSALRGAAWEPVPRPNPVRAASRPATADRQAQLSSSQPVSVTLHADGGVVQLVARIGGGPQSAEFMRLSSQLLAEGGLSLSGLILDGRRLGRASRR